MYTRYITYDLYSSSSEDYDDLYKLIENYKGVQITESTYKIKTEDDWKTFKSKFTAVTKEKDKVVAIVLNRDDSIEDRTIR